MQLLQNVSDIGVSRTVVKFRDATREQYDTLFTLSLIPRIGRHEPNAFGRCAG